MILPYTQTWSRPERGKSEEHILVFTTDERKTLHEKTKIEIVK